MEIARGRRIPGTNRDGLQARPVQPLLVRICHPRGTEDQRALLLDKLEALRLVCKTSGCARRYLTHDALNGIWQATHLTDANRGTDYSQRFLNYLHEVKDRDLTLGVAMTDAKGDLSLLPGKQVNRDVYVPINERRPDGIVIRETKAIVIGGPYMHEFLVIPCRAHVPEGSAFAVCCGSLRRSARHDHLTPRRPGNAAAKFSAKYGQAVAMVVFDDVFVPHDCVFLAGETKEGDFLTTSYATEHRHSCVGARAGFGDLLIGAGALMIEANGR